MRYRIVWPWVCLSAPASACPDCAASVAARSLAWEDPNALLYLSLFIAPFAVVAGVAWRTPARAPVFTAGTLLGVGLGGFVDGILLHQILQWHNMLSTRIPPVDLVSMKVNMVWDGLFHAFTWTTTVLGVIWLWRAAPFQRTVQTTRTFVGALLLGWGLFNVVEGLINHQLLAIHHVHPGEGQVAWDVGFLGFGAALVAVGWAAVRSGQSHGGPHSPMQRPVIS